MADNPKTKEAKSKLTQLEKYGERLLETKEYANAERTFLEALMLIRRSGIDEDPKVKIQKIKIIKNNGDLALSMNDPIKAASIYLRLAKEELDMYGNETSLKNFLDNMDKVETMLDVTDRSGNAIYAAKGFIETGLRYGEYKDVLANAAKNGNVHALPKKSKEIDYVLLKSTECIYGSLKIIENLSMDPNNRNYGFLLAEIKEFGVFNRDRNILKMCADIAERMHLE